MSEVVARRQRAAADWFEALQQRMLIDAFETLEQEASGAGSAPGKFEMKAWSRVDHGGAPGGGGRMAVLRGRLFEKAGVHCSTVFGTFAGEFASQIKGAEDDPRFWAAANAVADRPSLEPRKSRRSI